MRVPVFRILPIHRKLAARLNVRVKLAKNPEKKLDVFDIDTGEKIASIGATGYWDYQLYKMEEKKGNFPPGHADKKRSAYRARHKGEEKIKDSPGYFAWYILW